MHVDIYSFQIMAARIRLFLYFATLALIVSPSPKWGAFSQRAKAFEALRSENLNANFSFLSPENPYSIYLPLIINEPIHNDEFAETALTALVSPGDKSLPVTSNAGFGVGDKVLINPGGSTAEEGVIAALGSLVLDNGVINYHYAGEIIKDLEVIRIPAGEFQMGCDGMNNGGYSCIYDELPLHAVYLDSYFIDKYEVSNEKYARCANTGLCTIPEGFGSFTRGSYYDNSAYSSYPVINVDWDAADRYCRAIGKRLPTEAEWERAARGAIDTRPWPWGGYAPECGRMNFGWRTPLTMPQDYISCIGDTTPVGLYAPRGASPEGILNMAGNVYEWVNDVFDENYYKVSPYKNPPGPTGSLYRVIRGGAFRSNDLYPQVGVTHRVCNRGAEWARDPYFYVGIRCADSP